MMAAATGPPRSSSSAPVPLPAVRLLKNERNMGFGWSYRRGVDAAALEHIVMVHGDNAWGWATLREFFSRTGEADVIIGFTRDMWKSRTWTRTLISKTFTLLVNLITWRRSAVLQRAADSPGARPQEPAASNRAAMDFRPKCSSRRCGSTKTVVEVPMDLIEREKGESKAFRVKNFVDVFRTLKLLVALEWSRHELTPEPRRVRRRR